MKILSLETSCDETSAAVVEGGKKILSNIVASSADMHAKTGGVIPENAAREQIKSIIPILHAATQSVNKLTIPKNIDAIAVTVGPGLIGSLLVGVETAKTLSYLWNKPIIPVNHLIAHIYANWLASPKDDEGGPQFPALALVVSGGHTDLVYMKSHDNIKYIGGTRDDAAGEAFDKGARILGLPYPGGPNLAKVAEKFIKKHPDAKFNLFPRPMLNEDNFDWSFSGLKTAVANFIKKNPNFDKSKIAAEIQQAIVDSLVEKSLRAIENYNPKSFLLAGGVAANKRLRNSLQSRIAHHQMVSDSGQLTRIKLYIPEFSLCTDNAAPIGAAAYYNYHPIPWQKICANPELTITDK